jgi:cell fate (sporulation/competence/biofilm development) regulator YlbF (YheA/YmcA/DUF963 family)
MEVQLVGANKCFLLWGRGTGKTTGALAPRIAHVADAMPGHMSCLLGLSYTHLDTNVIPKILLGLQENGYKKDKHFVTGRPPKSFKKCLYPIKNWDRTITWYNGTSFQQISINEKGSANAFDFQSLFCDEAKFFKQKDIEGEVLPTLRGFKEEFSHLPEYLSQWYATDKYADFIQVKWLLDKRKLVDHRKVQAVIQLQLWKDELAQQFANATSAERIKIKRALKHIQARLNFLRKDLVFVSEASAEDNRKNLGEKWWAEQNAKPKYELDVAVKNMDPSRSENGFYPGLRDDLHTYQEKWPNWDYDRFCPFIIAMDYQASIAPLCACQLRPLEPSKPVTLNFIKEFYALHPKGLEDAVDAFCKNYESHSNKFLYYVYDNTAIGSRPSAKKVKDIVLERLQLKGWAVQEIYTGQQLEHFDRYQKIKARMEEKSKDNFAMRFNRTQCTFTLLSMQGAGTTSINGVTKKDKKYENVRRYPEADQRETTHFSEVVDQIDYAVNELKIIAPGGEAGGISVGIR